MKSLVRDSSSLTPPAKVVLILSPDPDVADKMPSRMVFECNELTLIQLTMIEVPRLGDYISLAGVTCKVVDVEWVNVEDYAAPYHPVLVVEKPEDEDNEPLPV